MKSLLLPEDSEEGFSQAFAEELSSLKKPLNWNLRKSTPWWRAMGFENEEVARRVESDVDISLGDKLYYISETPNFEFEFIRMPYSNLLNPNNSNSETLIVSLKEDCSKRNVPAAYSFFEKAKIDPKVIRGITDSRFSLIRRLNGGFPSIELETQYAFPLKRSWGAERLADIPQAKQIIETIIRSSFPLLNTGDLIFSGNGIDNPVAKKSMQEFRTNLWAAYGLECSHPSSGVYISTPNYGT